MLFVVMELGNDGRPTNDVCVTDDLVDAFVARNAVATDGGDPRIWRLTEVPDEVPDVLPVEMAAPRIVCLCGSTRFGEAFRDANLNETLKGRIVLSIDCDTKSDDALPDEAALAKAMLDDLHKRKIDLADEVLVLNMPTPECPDGYIGESTRSEIAYALAHGKPVRYTTPRTVAIP